MVLKINAEIPGDMAAKLTYEVQRAAVSIEKLSKMDLPDDWKVIFTDMMLKRCWKRLPAEADLKAISMGGEPIKALCTIKKCGLDLLCTIASIEDEAQREKIVTFCLGNDLKENTKVIEAMVSMCDVRPMLPGMEDFLKGNEC